MEINSLPRLLPLWNSYTINKSLNGNKCYKSFLDVGEIPDFGGCGVDFDFSKVTSSSEDDQVLIPHKFESEFKFLSLGPTLPFLPPVKRKAGKQRDPCVSKVQEDYATHETFFTKLEYFRRTMKNRNTSFRQKIFQLKDRLEQEDPVRLRLSKKLKTLVDIIPEDIAEEEPQMSDYNPLYRGGTMAMLGDGRLVHATAKRRFGITQLKEDYGLDGLSRLEPNLTEEFKLEEKGRVLQIDASPHNNFCVRQRNCLSIYSTESPSPIYSLKRSLEYVKMSPYVPDEFAFVSLDGEFGMMDYSAPETLVSKQMRAGWATVDYGSHPRHLVVCHPKSLKLYDVRAKTKKKLLNLNSAEMYVLYDEQLGLVHHTRGHYHLLATTHQLLVCDERYPTQPVLFWRHMLQSAPQVCHEVQLPGMDDSLVLLCSQSPAESVLVNYKTQQGWVQSLGSPQHADSPASGARFIPVNHHPRLKVSHTGGVMVPHRMSSSFSVLLQSSLGDVFYQDYIKRTCEEKQYKAAPLIPSWSSLDTEDPYYVPPQISRKKICKRLKNLLPKPGLEYVELDDSVLWCDTENNKKSSQDMDDQLFKLMETGDIQFVTQREVPQVLLDAIPEVDPTDKLSQSLLSVWEKSEDLPSQPEPSLLSPGHSPTQVSTKLLPTSSPFKEKKLTQPTITSFLSSLNF